MYGQVLYLEGKTAFADEVKLVLKDLNCSIFSTHNIVEVGQLFDKYTIDLVIIDLGYDNNKSFDEMIDFLKNGEAPLIFFADNTNRNIYEEVRQANVMAYLVSPIDMITFRSIATYALKHKSNKTYDKWANNKYLNDTLFIKVNQLLQRVNISDIFYVKSEGNYCLIFTHEKKYAIKLSMVRLYNTLLAKGFLQVHKSYLVKLDKIDNIDISGNEVILGEIRIPLGRKYKQELLAHLNLL